MADCAAILLAAGRSRRFGEQNKLLANVAGRPLVLHVASAFAHAMPTARRILVVGPDGADICSACAAQVTETALNPAPERGLASSIAVGVRALLDAETRVAGVIVSQTDMPGLTAGVIERLLDAFATAGRGRIVFPTDRTGRQRTPVVWPASFFERLAKLEGDSGGKSLIAEAASRGQTAAVELGSHEADAVVDIDTQSQLADWRARLGGGGASKPDRR